MPNTPFGYILFTLFVLFYLCSCNQETPKPVCQDPRGCVTIDPGEPIKIGVLQSLSGPTAPLGREQVHGLDLALNKRHGTLVGHAVALQTEDTGCTKEGGANAALKVIADPQTTAIFGTTCSGAAITAAQVMSDAGLIMVSGNNSAPFLTAIDGKQAPHWQPGYFRTAPNEEHSGRAAATYAYTTLGIRQAATLNDGDIYTRGLTDGFARTFADLGGTIVLDASIDKGDDDMGPILTAVSNSQAELLFFPLFQPEGNHVLFQARHMPQLNKIMLMSGGALIEQSFLSAMGDLAQGIYFIGPSPASTPRSLELAREYALTFKTTPAASYYQNAFDAAELMLQAIEQTAVQHDDGSVSIGREALRHFLYERGDVDGVTGTIHCDQFGDCAYPRFNVLRLDNPKEGVQGLQKNVQYTYEPVKNAALPKGLKPVHQ